MDRNHVLNLMSQLRLRGMRASYDEVLADGTRRKHPPQRIVAQRCWKWRWRQKSAIDSADDHCNSMAKDIDFGSARCSESLIHQLADGGLLEAGTTPIM